MGTEDEDDTARRRFDVADTAPLLLDERGVVTSWTRDAERLLGYPAAEAVGRDLAALLTPADAGRVADVLARCREDGGWAGLLSARRRDGRPVPVMARVTSAHEPGGPARWLALLNEMSDAPGWNMSRSVLEQMVGDSPIGIAIVNTDLRFVWSNAALARFGGGPPERRLGLRLADVQPGLDSVSIEAQMRRVLESGEPVIGYELLGTVQAAPHRETAHMLSFTRLEDERGGPMGVYYTVVDMTERHRARQRLALLDRAGRRIGSSLDITRTAQELADVAVPDFADVVTVDLLEPVLRGAEPAPARWTGGPDDSVTLRRAGRRRAGEAGRTADADAPGGPPGIAAVVYPAGSPPMRCLAHGRPWRVDRLEPDGPRGARGPGDPADPADPQSPQAPQAPDGLRDPGGPRDRDGSRGPLAGEWAAVLPAGSGPPSALIVPVRARGTVLGVTTFLRREGREPFDDDDLALAEDLVSRAAVCVDNARRYTRERDAALVLQRNLLPRRLPEQDAVEVAACYRPADELTGLGGDWYDLIPLSGARVALVVGEVPGHGIDAAAAMGRVRTAVRTLAALDLPPAEILAHLDDLVTRMDDEEADAEGEERVPADARSGTDGRRAAGSACVYVVYDPVDGRCVMAAAGHPAPAVVLPGGSVEFVDLPQGPALGVGGPPFESAELVLPEGSTLALHTDGLLADGERWAPDTDRERLRGALERPADALDLRCRTVIDALVPARPYDDVALLMARTRRLPAGQVADWELPADPAAVAEARKTASRRLAEWGLPELSFTTELVVSELVTNAIRYATGPIRLRLIRGRSLFCGVFDGGATAPHLRHPRATDEGGRGLLLVSQVTQRWGTRFLPEGKVIWAEQSLTDPGV
ncbi:PAS domain S-box-containing protein [Streptomyces achromogenes]|uniref:SpoIIE family protein phosphatase n=1 Tax=Streptomyces achromogenes TaxID=67255 RepID=UPI00278908EC|nr:SpoIIE family protein phosphatase [Streptomyces achromogenes]MDQ0829476.1 PAS domain S-box-containing protein [Streptomyces achromogenes]